MRRTARQAGGEGDDHDSLRATADRLRTLAGRFPVGAGAPTDEIPSSRVNRPAGRQRRGGVLRPTRARLRDAAHAEVG